MDKLAVELLTDIFFYACTDGGQTGCALALVSKRIRAISRPARFFSVALFSSPAKIEQFLHAYQQERARPAHMLPRVRHLWLSYDENGEGHSGMPGVSALPARPPTSRAEFVLALQRRTQSWRSAQASLDEQYNRVIPMLVREVAPDLHSLALNQARWRSGAVVRCRFPRLQELTCIGGDPSFLPFAAAEAEAEGGGKPLYPALRRLHHILTPNCKDVNFLNWGRHAPALTHLRVSRLDFWPRMTAETLEQVISECTVRHGILICSPFCLNRRCVLERVLPKPAETDHSSAPTTSARLEHVRGVLPPIHAVPARASRARQGPADGPAAYDQGAPAPGRRRAEGVYRELAQAVDTTNRGPTRMLGGWASAGVGVTFEHSVDIF